MAGNKGWGMKFYKCNFQGRYPVGASAVVVASSPENAKDMLETQLASIGLRQDVPIDSLFEVCTTGPSVHILCYGDY